MYIKSDFNRIMDTSRKMRHFELEVETLLFQMLDEIKDLLEASKTPNDLYEVRRVCNSILDSTNKIRIHTKNNSKSIRRLQMSLQYSILDFIASDKIDKIN